MNPPKIMILEEDLQLLWILKTYLENEGFQVVAHDKIEKVRETMGKEKMSVFITTEYWLNRSDVIGIIKQLKKSHPQVYIILISYRLMNEKEFEDFLIAGVDDLLEKPFSLGKISVLLNKRLGIDSYLASNLESTQNQTVANRTVF